MCSGKPGKADARAAKEMVALRPRAYVAAQSVPPCLPRMTVRLSTLKLPTMRRELRGLALAVVMIAVTSLVAVLLRHYLGILRGSVLYLVPVMLAGYQLGMIPALVTAVAGVIVSGYLYFAQLYSFKVASPQEALNLVLYMVVAVVVSHLAN